MSAETTPEFYTAFAAAQSEFPVIPRNKEVKVRTKTGGEYTFSYATLDAIMGAVLPALNKHGFGVSQAPTDGREEPDGYLVTRLTHAHGCMSNRVKIIQKEDGPQGYGSALTYARRYGITLLLGIAADEDDDGNAAEGNSASTKDRGHSAGREARHSPDPKGQTSSAGPMGSVDFSITAPSLGIAISQGLSEQMWQIHEKLNDAGAEQYSAFAKHYKATMPDGAKEWAIFLDFVRARQAERRVVPSANGRSTGYQS